MTLLMTLSWLVIPHADAADTLAVGDEGQPYTTVSDAIEAAGDGDIIVVQDGALPGSISTVTQRNLTTVSYTHLRAPRDQRGSRMPSSA